MATTWKDATSFSRGEVDRTPRTWEVRANNVQITVTRHVQYDPDVWLCTCHTLEIDLYPLSSKDIDEAKKEALQLCYVKAKRIFDSVRQLAHPPIADGEWPS